MSREKKEAWDLLGRLVIKENLYVLYQTNQKQTQSFCAVIIQCQRLFSVFRAYLAGMEKTDFRVDLVKRSSVLTAL